MGIFALRETADDQVAVFCSFGSVSYQFVQVVQFEPYGEQIEVVGVSLVQLFVRSGRPGVIAEIGFKDSTGIVECVPDFVVRKSHQGVGKGKILGVEASVERIFHAGDPACRIGKLCQFIHFIEGNG